ncbi:hypothetical protein KIPB_005555 [Kipferlia bialata]|uniref:Uncharacterized protein n=1 Tax=Kipferlia bialata TaxID=797122 RepID=A0A9K3CXF0_9EUKA|nr:hypothetical protein KIPB_005555 [Kipferlia bialata]|eukprot:g5555.t1
MNLRSVLFQILVAQMAGYQRPSMGYNLLLALLFLLSLSSGVASLSLFGPDDDSGPHDSYGNGSSPGVFTTGILVTEAQASDGYPDSMVVDGPIALAGNWAVVSAQALLDDTLCDAVIVYHYVEERDEYYRYYNKWEAAANLAGTLPALSAERLVLRSSLGTLSTYDLSGDSPVLEASTEVSLASDSSTVTALSLSGDTLVVGTSDSRVFVYTLSQSPDWLWSLTAELLPIVPVLGVGSGFGLALDLLIPSLVSTTMESDYYARVAVSTPTYASVEGTEVVDGDSYPCVYIFETGSEGADWTQTGVVRVTEDVSPDTDSLSLGRTVSLSEGAVAFNYWHPNLKTAPDYPVVQTYSPCVSGHTVSSGVVSEWCLVESTPGQHTSYAVHNYFGMSSGGLSASLAVSSQVAIPSYVPNYDYYQNSYHPSVRILNSSDWEASTNASFREFEVLVGVTSVANECRPAYEKYPQGQGERLILQCGTSVLIYSSENEYSLAQVHYGQNVVTYSYTSASDTSYECPSLDVCVVNEDYYYSVQPYDDIAPNEFWSYDGTHAYASLYVVPGFTYMIPGAGGMSMLIPAGTYTTPLWSPMLVTVGCLGLGVVVSLCLGKRLRRTRTETLHDTHTWDSELHATSSASEVPKWLQHLYVFLSTLLLSAAKVVLVIADVFSVSMLVSYLCWPGQTDPKESCVFVQAVWEWVQRGLERQVWPYYVSFHAINRPTLLDIYLFPAVAIVVTVTLLSFLRKAIVHVHPTLRVLLSGVYMLVDAVSRIVFVILLSPIWDLVSVSHVDGRGLAVIAGCLCIMVVCIVYDGPSWYLYLCTSLKTCLSPVVSAMGRTLSRWFRSLCGLFGLKDPVPSMAKCVWVGLLIVLLDLFTVYSVIYTGPHHYIRGNTTFIIVALVLRFVGPVVYGVTHGGMGTVLMLELTDLWVVLYLAYMAVSIAAGCVVFVTLLINSIVTPVLLAVPGLLASVVGVYPADTVCTDTSMDVHYSDRSGVKSALKMSAWLCIVWQLVSIPFMYHSRCLFTLFWLTMSMLLVKKIDSNMLEPYHTLKRLDRKGVTRGRSHSDVCEKGDMYETGGYNSDPAVTEGDDSSLHTLEMAGVPLSLQADLAVSHMSLALYAIPYVGPTCRMISCRLTSPSLSGSVKNGSGNRLPWVLNVVGALCLLYGGLAMWAGGSMLSSLTLVTYVFVLQQVLDAFWMGRRLLGVTKATGKKVGDRDLAGDKEKQMLMEEEELLGDGQMPTPNPNEEHVPLLGADYQPVNGHQSVQVVGDWMESYNQ